MKKEHDAQMNKKLDGYKGRLTAEQIAAGMNAARENAKRLADDAELLLKANRFPSAASLAILSIEEAGKVTVLRSLTVARDDEEVKKCWRDYRSHTRKNVNWLLPELVAKGARRLDDFRPLFDEASDHPFVLDQVKQIGFYTDCLGDAHWSRPEEIVDEQLATMLVRVAILFTKGKEVTTKELELWIKHMGPAWRLDEEKMKQALINWHTEMQQLGLAPRGENKMEQFITSGITI